MSHTIFVSVYLLTQIASIILFFIDQATSEKNVEEDWDIIMQICDEAGKVTDAKIYLKAILRRLSHSDPHIGLKAVTVSKDFVKYFSVLAEIKCQI